MKNSINTEHKADAINNPEAYRLKSGVENKKIPLSSVEKLTEKQRVVYHLFFNDKLKVSDIAQRRNTSDKNIYKMLKSIIKKTSKNNHEAYRLKNSKPMVVENMLNLKKSNQKRLKKYWRYHNLHFVITPHFISKEYHSIRHNLGNYSIKYKGWVIHLNKATIELQTQRKWDFKASDIYQATEQAQRQFNLVLDIISKKYGFEVWREGIANIRLVQHHLARAPSEVANARGGAYLQIKNEKGKVWFIVDKSKIAEHEYVAQNCLQDSEKLEPYFNDLLNNQPPTLSETFKAVHLIALNQDAYNVNIVKHLEIMDKMGKTLDLIQQNLLRGK